MPSPSESSGQPSGPTATPFGVLAQRSRSSGIPSPSESLVEQPSALTLVPCGVAGHLSRYSGTPSPSESSGPPLTSTCTDRKAAGLGQGGSVSLNPGGRRILNKKQKNKA